MVVAAAVSCDCIRFGALFPIFSPAPPLPLRVTVPPVSGLSGTA